MLKLHVLASGSKGNAAIVENAESGAGVLIDCGICKRDFLERCDEAGFDPARLEAVFITHEHGDHTKGLGVVLRGTVHIENLDLWGSKSILSSISAGQAFAETYALCGDVMMVDAVAAEECEVLFVNISAFSGGAPGTVHEKLLRNLLTVSMRKNLSLSQRIFCTTPKTVRGRLLTYFSAQAARSGSLQFEIPFNRQQLADYLNLDRSALSKELCKMRDEGLLTFEKNRFALNELPE